jgi:hypothetical protein
MFQLYANLLSVNAKYAWNKIVYKHTASVPYTDLQGCSKKGPRGLLHKSFNDSVMFHLLAVFSNNMAEKERYYITNVLKKPQRVSICQFVQHVEPPNLYIPQLPCWYYSPNANPSIVSMNIPFAKADLASRVLLMCSHMWQDQFNLHEKCITPVDMCLLLLSLEAIERVFTQERSNTQSKKKSSHKSKKENKRPGIESMGTVPKKACAMMHWDLCKKHGGAYTMQNNKDCCRYKKDRMEKSDFCTTKKGRKKPNPTKHSFVQLSKKMDRLE